MTRSAASQRRRVDNTLHAPAACALVEEMVEASLHVIPRTLHDDIALVFPELATAAAVAGSSGGGGAHAAASRVLLAIPTFHVSAMQSIIEITDATELERLRLYQRFARFASALGHALRRRDGEAWSDWADLDGSAATTDRTMTIYDEVSGAKAMLGYRGTLCQCVPLIVHPIHGYHRLCVHTIIMWARAEDAKAALVELLAEWCDDDNESATARREVGGGVSTVSKRRS